MTNISIRDMLNMNGFGLSSIANNNILGGCFGLTGSNTFFDMSGLGLGSFGGFNSIFTNYDGTCNYTAVGGFAAGMAVFNIAGAAVSQAVSDRKANSKEVFQAQVKDIDEKIDAKLEKLGIDSVDQLNSVKPDSKFDADILSAQAEVNTLKDSINKLKAPTELGANATEEEKTKYNEALVKYNKDKSELKKQLEVANTNLEEAITAKEEEIDRIAKIKSEINELLIERNEKASVVDDKTLDKADGKGWQKTSVKDYNNKFDKTTGKLVENVTIEKGDVKRGIDLFRTCENDADKLKYANQIKTLYDATKDTEDWWSKDFKGVMTIINNYIKENS